MAFELITTVAAEDANSYVDELYADDYWSVHFNAMKAAQWAALNDDQKVAALLQATRVLETVKCTRAGDSEYDRYSVYQALQFPRVLDVDSADAPFIPEGVKFAQCEQAFYLLNLDDSALSTRLQGVVSDSLSIGRGQINLRQEYAQTGTSLAPMAVEFLRPFFLKSARLGRA